MELIIYKALIEMGWIIATTEKEIKWFEAANEDSPPFDVENGLKDIMSRIKGEYESAN